LQQTTDGQRAFLKTLFLGFAKVLPYRWIESRGFDLSDLLSTLFSYPAQYSLRTPEKGPQDKAMNSYNHYAYGAVGAWIYQTVAGLDLDLQEPGYKHIIFKPRPGGSLTWAEAELKISSGKARIRWEKTPKGLSLDLHVPSGSRATLIPPPEYGGPRKLKSGRHQISLHSRRA
jgi:hypothetical protein